MEMQKKTVDCAMAMQKRGVRFRLCRERPSANERGAAYEVGHGSAPAAGADGQNAL